MDAPDLKSILSKVLIVDDDSLCLKMTQSQIKALGATDISTTESGLEASSLIKEQDFSLIVLDWKLPDISGLSLFNRIRHFHGRERTPLLVISGFVNKVDFTLLQEFSHTLLAEKPYTQKVIKDRISKLAEEVTWYTQNESIIQEVYKAVDFNPAKLAQVLKGVCAKAPNPTPLILLGTKTLIHSQSYKAAQNVLEHLLSKDPSAIRVQNELGKVLMLQRKFAEAVKILNQAEQFSSANVQRLCMLGESELNLTHFEAAREHFSNALQIDPQEPKATAGYQIAQNVLEYHSKPINLGLSFASILNTVGISLIKSGNFQKGVDQYQSALSFLNNPVDHAKIAFNLGLGYLKWGKNEPALTWFKKSLGFGNNEYSKPKSYVENLERGIERILRKATSLNSPDELSGADIAPAEDPSNSQDIQKSEDQVHAKLMGLADPNMRQEPLLGAELEKISSESDDPVEVSPDIETHSSQESTPYPQDKEDTKSSQQKNLRLSGSKESADANKGQKPKDPPGSNYSQENLEDNLKPSEDLEELSSKLAATLNI